MFDFVLAGGYDSNKRRRNWASSRRAVPEGACDPLRNQSIGTSVGGVTGCCGRSHLINSIRGCLLLSWRQRGVTQAPVCGPQLLQLSQDKTTSQPASATTIRRTQSFASSLMCHLTLPLQAHALCLCDRPPQSSLEAYPVTRQRWLRLAKPCAPSGRHGPRTATTVSPTKRLKLLTLSAGPILASPSPVSQPYSHSQQLLQAAIIRQPRLFGSRPEQQKAFLLSQPARAALGPPRW